MEINLIEKENISSPWTPLSQFEFIASKLSTNALFYCDLFSHFLAVMSAVWKHLHLLCKLQYLLLSYYHPYLDIWSRKAGVLVFCVITNVSVMLNKVFSPRFLE